MEADAGKRFAHAILRTQDQMSLLQFATTVRELTPFTNKAAQIDRGLAQLRGDFATALYDAIYLGAERLGRKDGRKVLVLATDGGDTASSTTYAQALEQALRNEVMIYSIIDVPIEASAGRELGGEHALITLAEQTGGKSFYVSDGGLDKAFAKVSDDLRTPIFARLLSSPPGAGQGLPPDRGHHSPRHGPIVQCAPQDGLLHGLRSQGKLIEGAEHIQFSAMQPPTLPSASRMAP